MKRFMTFVLLAAFALPVATTPMFAKQKKAKKMGKKGKRMKMPGQK
jgi:hypothetical protein